MKIINIVGARPNYMKVAPIHARLLQNSAFDVKLVHTGQHYDENMSKIFFDELQMPKPDYYLEVKGGTHARQTALIMERFEEVLFAEKPDFILVAGDVNSTIACALTAAKLHIKIAHLESGLRSFDRRMPEEVNRVLTDQISDICLLPSEDARENLLNEGIDASRIYFVGNAMIDTLDKFLPHIQSQTKILEACGVKPKEYAVLTLHRPSNVDDIETFNEIMDAVLVVAEEIKVIFAAHPRVREAMKSRGLHLGNVEIIDPLGYVDFLKLQSEAAFVLTDSGGLQEETTCLNVPCLTLRENTERPITINEGTNVLVGTKGKDIISAASRVMASPPPVKPRPKYWDGNTAGRVEDVFMALLQDA
jgi:UDP-N-acetylglucosamine 2-epimerase (non-hydrolysing)